MKWRRKKRGLEEMDDFEVMDCVQKGDTEAFALLVRRYQETLLNFFRRLGVYTDAEDLVQESFVRVYKNRVGYQPTARFSTFLHRVARTVWIDWVRRTARRDDALSRYEDHLDVGESGVPCGTAERMDAQAATESLPEKLRLVVVLSIYQGLKYREIAEILDIPVGTVKSRMHLAIEQLREFMNVRINGQ
ncbi:MAG: sigma-70 family RNA polymerase sigma factor [Verrucomicrobia bacterium]|nr:sigma-70 family RNA polymerase sigma factor [Verrucomicrobiota bacterium]